MPRAGDVGGGEAVAERAAERKPAPATGGGRRCAATRCPVPESAGGLGQEVGEVERELEVLEAVAAPGLHEGTGVEDSTSQSNPLAKRTVAISEAGASCARLLTVRLR